MWWARRCQASYPVPVTGLVWKRESFDLAYGQNSKIKHLSECYILILSDSMLLQYISVSWLRPYAVCLTDKACICRVHDTGSHPVAEHVDSHDGKHLPVSDYKIRERVEETGKGSQLWSIVKGELTLIRLKKKIAIKKSFLSKPLSW